jgi:carboxymethylenebutenolidase
LTRRGLAGAAFGGYAVFAFSAEAQPIHTDEAGLITESVQLAAGDQLIPGYVARPDAPGRYPSIIVVSEVFGVHEYIRDVCRRLAKLGYVALAPDFFVRAGDPSVTEDFNQIRKIVGAASDQQVMNDLGAALAFLKVQDYADSKKLGLVGFCWGGAVVWQGVARFTQFKAGVAWYGRLAAPAPGEFLGDPGRTWPIQLAGELNAPVLGLYAGKDQGISAADIDAMRQALKAAHRKDEIIVYPEAQHGFHADYRASYDPAAAKDGWTRMLDHLRRNGLAPKPPQS